jgi:CubicO group peptidase (beta-lactamase class C family)
MLALNMSSVATIGWIGSASSNSWIDPIKEIIGFLLLQLPPILAYPATNDFRAAVYQLLIS